MTSVNTKAEDIRLRFRLILVFLCVFGFTCSSQSPTDSNATSGTLKILTYNIRGLPESISSSNPQKNIPLISPLLNKYDIALIQEDFAYHDALKSNANHPYQSSPSVKTGDHFYGNGLSRFSVFRMEDFLHEEWQRCVGIECSIQKGFTMARTILARDVSLDIYNLHMAAGDNEDEILTRATQVEQFLDALALHSPGNAVIIGGDFNLDTMRRLQDAALFSELISEGQLLDACRSVNCRSELVDKILFRGSNSINIEAVSWQIDSAFVDENGCRLSDHFAVAVEMNWEKNNQLKNRPLIELIEIFLLIERSYFL